MNELKDICERLEGYRENKWYVTRAVQVEPGKWVIDIEKEKPEGETCQEETNADK